MIHFTLNQQPVALDLPTDFPLLHALREHLGLHSPRFGCGLEQCGACHVLIDGRSTPTCASTLDRVAQRQVTTIEAGRADSSDPMQPIFAALQQAFVAEEAAQCGYCTNGLLISAAALLASEPQADDTRIRQALDPHLCRCGAHVRVLRAVARAAHQLRSGDSA